jgi:hypothetical protein
MNKNIYPYTFLALSFKNWIYKEKLDMMKKKGICTEHHTHTSRIKVSSILNNYISQIIVVQYWDRPLITEIQFKS